MNFEAQKLFEAKSEFKFLAYLECIFSMHSLYRN